MCIVLSERLEVERILNVIIWKMRIGSTAVSSFLFVDI